MTRAKRKTRMGVVVGNKMQKTAVVEVERVFRHPFYQKAVRAFKKYKVHDENNECAIGDLVEIMETRPLSKNKRWRLVKILGKGKVSAREFPRAAAKEETTEGNQ